MRKTILILVALMFLASFTGSLAWSADYNADNNSILQQYRDQYQALYGGETEQSVDSAHISKFMDTRYHWGSSSIERIATLGLLQGYTDGTFRPNVGITQEEMIVLLMRLVDKNTLSTLDNDQQFSALPDWARESVQGAANNDFISMSRFQANTLASRAITCVAFAKMLGLQAVSIDKVNFADKNQIANNDLGYILAMYEAKYVTGTSDNQFKPNNSITRAEMAVILERILALIPESTPEPIDLKTLGDNLTKQFNTIGNMRVNKITLTGDNYSVNVKISVDSDNNAQNEWDDLLYADITDWVNGLCISIQNQTAEYTKVKGHITYEGNYNVLFSFTKDGEKNIEGSYGNKNDVDETAKELQGKRYYIDEISFKVTDITYNAYDGRMNVSLKAQGAVTSAKWRELTDVPSSENEVEKGIKRICNDITNTFTQNAGANPQFINVYLYRFESQNLLDRYAYDAVEEKLK